MRKNKNISETAVIKAFYNYSDEHKVLDYEYFVNVYLPKFLDILDFEGFEELNKFIKKNKKLFDDLKARCGITLDTSAKQDAIQYIKEFGKNKKDKIIINIFKTKKNED